MPPSDDLSSLEHARERLYARDAPAAVLDEGLVRAGAHETPHAWQEKSSAVHRRGKRHVRLAAYFFGFAFAFFLIAGGIAGYLLYYGGNTVSVNNIDVAIQGPTTIAGGDTVPLSLAITNRNPVAVTNATIEVDFPSGSRSADNLLTPYPRYTENLGTLASGETVTRSIKAVVFGAAGQSLSLPVSFSFGAAGSSATFVKKSTYALAISSTPLSVSVDTLAETVSGKPLSLSLTVRNNATVPIDNVVVQNSLPFGFTVASSSLPLSGSSFVVGTLAPGASKDITLSGTLVGQDSEQRVFHFTVGTAQTAGDSAIAVTYMTQDATVTIVSPFIATALSINGASSATPVVAPGAKESVTVSYANTLSTNVTNATVAVQLSGAVDYGSVATTNGYYDSSTHTVLFSQDTDPSLASMAPGASGLGTFSFSTLPATTSGAPQVTFTISVSGTRVGQANVPEQVSASQTVVAKVTTAVALSALSYHTTGPFANTGPIPPKPNTPTTYTIVWRAQDEGSAVAGASVSAILPSYVTFTGKTSGAVTYDSGSRTVTWNAADLTPGGVAEAAFQVSFTPSSAQQGTAPVIVGPTAFTGYDRYSGVQVTTSANAVTTETTGDPGYVPTDSTVQ